MLPQHLSLLKQGSWNKQTNTQTNKQTNKQTNNTRSTDKDPHMHISDDNENIIYHYI